MLGKEYEVGDYLVFPAGNPRFGGLKLAIGQVVKITAKRIRIKHIKSNKEDYVTGVTSVTGQKALIIPASVVNNEIIRRLDELVTA